MCIRDSVTRVALWVMTGASVLACVLLAFGFFRPRAKQVVAGIVIYVGLYVVGVLALPYLFQALVVRPNELSLETPYLNHYIDFTRKAYKLDGIQAVSYTHLDVYKRQAIASRSNWDSGKPCMGWEVMHTTSGWPP